MTRAPSTKTSKPKQTKPATTDKAVAIAKRLVNRAILDGAICYCPITGLPVSHDLPPSLDVLMINCHPLALNAIRLLDSPQYIASFSNEQLAGLILGLLAEANKISISPKSNALLVRAKLEAIASRNNLLDIIEWIANSLLTTKLYYPTLSVSHDSLTIESLEEYMAWTYSIEVYSFGGSKPDKIKEPKALAVTNPATKVKRLTKAYAASLAELVDELETSPAAAIAAIEVTSPAIVANLNALLRGKADAPSSKLDNLLTALTMAEPIADIIADLINYRATIASLAGAQTTAIESLITDYLEPATAPATQVDAPTTVEQAAPTNPFMAKLAKLQQAKL